MATVTLTSTPPPNFFVSCKSTLQIYSSSIDAFIEPIGKNADINVGNYIQTRNDGEFSYPKSILNSPSFTIIMRLAFTNELGGANCIFDAYPKIKFQRNNGSDFGIYWKDINGTVHSLILPEDIEQEEIFEIAITRKYVSSDIVTTKLYFNGEEIGSNTGKEASTSMNDVTGDYVKISTPLLPANAKFYSLSIWNGEVLSPVAINNHYNDIANYYQTWESVPSSYSWEYAAFANLKIKESFRKDYLLFITNPLAVSDMLTFDWKGWLIFSESITFKELNPKNASKFLGENGLTIHDGDKLIKSFKKRPISLLTIKDIFDRTANFYKDYSEYINLLERNPKTIEIFYGDSHFMLHEGSPALAKYITKGVPQDINFAENLSKTSIWNRLYSEHLNLVERLGKDYLLQQDRIINIIEQYIRNANAVISDIEFRNEELDINSFIDITQSPTGYSPFRDFISGDYTYKEALIKVILNSDITADRPYIEEWTMNIDVPDVTDRGTAHTTEHNQPLWVPFNKKFHVPPEVVITLKTAENVSGELPVPAIYGITEVGFYLILKAGADYYEGNVTWTATGY